MFNMESIAKRRDGKRRREYSFHLLYLPSNDILSSTVIIPYPRHKCKGNRLEIVNNL